MCILPEQVLCSSRKSGKIYLASGINREEFSPSEHPTYLFLQFCRGPFLESESMVAVSGWVLEKIFLVCCVGLIKGGVIGNFCFHFAILVGSDFLVVNVLLELSRDGFGNYSLLFWRTKDDASVLGSSIVSLSVKRCRVVEAVKEFDQFLKYLWSFRCLLGEFDVENFNMPGAAWADLTIGRILHAVGVRIHKADLCVSDNSGKLFLKVLYNIFFCSPVTAARVIDEKKRQRIVSCCRSIWITKHSRSQPSKRTLRRLLV